MTTMTEAFATAKAQRAAEPRKGRTPLLAKVGRLAGRHAPRWERLRTTVLQVSALGLIDYGLFEVHSVAGFIGTGISLLVLDTFSGDE